MRILSYIDFYNQFSAFKGKKKIYIFFENFFLSEMVNQHDFYDKCLSIYQFQGKFLMAD